MGIMMAILLDFTKKVRVWLLSFGLLMLKTITDLYMKTFVIGDIHGNLVGLKKCLQSSRFDYKNDRLIALGDVCDRGVNVAQCILLSCKN